MSHKYVFMPGEEKTIDLDRAEGARYVGIAAGSYSLQKQNSVRLYSIPMVEEKRDNMIVYKYDRLVLSLFLGPQELKALGEKQ
jgi:predicted component of type VI protein secretion system